jgi:hypothetical protein
MADPKFSKQTVTNVSPGPRVLNSREGHILQPGQTLEDVDVNDAELEIAKATGYFEFGKAAAKRAAEESEAAPEETK